MYSCCTCGLDQNNRVTTEEEWKQFDRLTGGATGENVAANLGGRSCSEKINDAVRPTIVRRQKKGAQKTTYSGSYQKRTTAQAQTTKAMTELFIYV